MDPDQTAPGSTLFVYVLLVDDKNIHFVIMGFNVNKCEFSVYTVRFFYELHARLRGLKKAY